MTKRSTFAVICLVAGAALRLPAQSNTGEIFGGYSYAKINPEAPLPKQNSNGWVASVAAYPAKWFGASFDISAHFGDIPAPNGVTAPPLHFKEYGYLAGPQFRFLNTERAQSALRFLIGGSFGQVRTDSTTTGPQASALGSAGYIGFDQTKFAMLVAVPVDVTVSRLMALRVEPGLYLTDFNKTKQSNFRFSVGPVFRFGGR